ncbi:terminase large subunit [Tepidibacter thalassicus]|uniref:Phage terminase-like protein, large subunit, contains N-terminal HTH domain n=1 Tax=Tepidibacter thalassicus DSM 15285 TaxID=1123350 RepID=A0A1M5PVH3_9FIRM|nr:terminase TerL endonuclease subunit [Tepidibacter thalassicus]SHH06037.1 Phage terminase-like protein, large subunit, contains N-terminal HTH domain [Tepidibacter thalassicus DSM 15285]
MIDRVTKYAKDVIEGREFAGRYVRLACQRHLDDLERSKLATFKYEFDIEKSLKIIDFAETLTIAEGEEETPVKLEGFQDFILGSINGWVTKGTGYRRFRNSYIQLGRQNGKSFLNGILATYYGNFDGYKYGQIYCTATKMDQAKIVFKEIVKFINADNDLKELFKIKEYESTIDCLITNSTIKALGKDTKSIDGFRPLLGIVDEYHAHKDNQMYKLLEGGTRKMKQSLISVITTAGFNLNSPCYKLWEYCKNVLEGVFSNDKQFIYIAQMDKEDDIWNPQNWVKANPLVCKDKEDLENLIAVGKTAKDMGGSDLRDFLTKALNIWYKHSDNQYLNIDNWKKCACDLTLEDFRGKECGLGLDLSSGGDLTSGVLEFLFLENGEPAYFFHQHSFMPKMRLAEHIRTDNAPYDVWANEGLITLTETLGGIKTDYKYIISYFKELIEKYDLKLKVIAYDPHNADAFLSDLESFGVDCIEIKQSAKSLNTPTEDFKLSVDNGTVKYNKKDGLFKFCGVNAVITRNSFGEIKIDKEHRTERIDPIDAAIDIHKIMMKMNNKQTGIDVNKYADIEFLNKLWGV